jgi:hypothetical protein
MILSSSPHPLFVKHVSAEFESDFSHFHYIQLCPQSQKRPSSSGGYFLDDINNQSITQSWVQPCLVAYKNSLTGGYLPTINSDVFVNVCMQESV